MQRKEQMESNNSKTKRTRILYICTYALLSILFFMILYKPIAGKFFEDDLVWFIPSVSQLISGNSLIETLDFSLAPYPPQIGLEFGGTSLRTYAVAVLSLFGPESKYFIFVSLVFHFASSFLLFSVARKMGLSTRISFFSALTFLTLYPHFHTYVWPMGMHHLFVVFFTLLVLNFYLKTDQFISTGSSYRWYYALTLVLNLIASLCRTSILILPLMVVTHILFCSKDKAERIRKYWLWLPLLATYLLYPLISLPYDPVVYPKVRNVLNMIHIPQTSFEFPVLFMLGLSGLILLGFILKIQWASKIGKISIGRVSPWYYIAIFVVVIGVLIRLYIEDPRTLLIPLNLVALYAKFLGYFLMPLQSVLANDNTIRWHYISSQLSPFTIILACLFLITFVKAYVLKNRQTVILAPWYFACVVYLTVINPNLTEPVASRYFTNISPVFSIVLASVLITWYTHAMDRIKLKLRAREIVLILLVAILCVPNILAIRLEMFRGKLTDSYFAYDYIRAAQLVKEDITRSDNQGDIIDQDIYINNVPLLLYAEHWRDFSAADIHQFSYDSFRYALVWAFDDMSMLDIRVNENPGGNTDARVYRMDGQAIRRKDGVNIDPFLQFFEEGRKQIEAKQYEEAAESFQKAQQIRPFLFNHVLGKHPLDDLRWVTGGSNLRTFVMRTASYYRFYFPPDEKVDYISSLMNKEVSDYAECLFYLSWLSHRAGNPQQGEFWFSQIRYLEDYTALQERLSQTPILKADEPLLDFLVNRSNPSSGYPGSVYPWYDFKDYWQSHNFSKFLWRLTFGN